MKPRSLINFAVATIILLLTHSAIAATEEDEKKVCKLPKILDFTLPLYALPEKLEVEPESEYSFRVSGDVVVDKIKVDAKEKPLKIETKSNTSFVLVKGKLPAEFTGKYVRLDVTAGTDLNGCRAKAGWLIKVKG